MTEDTAAWRRTMVRAPMKAVLLVMMVLTAPAPLAANDDPRIAESMDYAGRLQAQLGARLKAALNDGGPAAAIAVCRVDAPAIAASLSEPGGPSRVGRTALRIRNPDNAPDDEAREILLAFQRELAADPESLPVAFTERPDGSARYMQAIVTQPMCLACHGSALSESVRDALAERYPDDQATGFEAGDLRGAFVVDWPSSGQNGSPDG